MSRCLATLILFLGMSLQDSQEPAPVRPPTVRRLEGFEIRIDPRLLLPDSEMGSRALRLLEVKLHEIAIALPAPALERLREVPIYLGVEDATGRFPCACYHKSAAWLEANGFPVERAKAVDILNARNFVDWSRDQPWMVLHELAHAYHDRVLAGEDGELRRAFEAAKGSGLYDEVLNISGSTVRHYALTNVEEYFAEGTEALFGTNDFFPFVRAEFARHDPQGHREIRRLWGLAGR